MKIDRLKNQGIVYSAEGNPVISFEILKHADQAQIDAERASMENSWLIQETFTVQDYTVASYGQYNRLPIDVRDYIKNNHLLPEILAKQVRFMYGEGPYFYREEIREDKTVRIPVSREEHKDVWNWLSSWKANGLADDVATYLKRAIREYYYTEGIFSKWRFNRSRRVGGRTPIRGLEYLPSIRMRMGMKKTIIPGELLEDEDLDTMLYGRWELPYRFDVEAFNRFDESDPFKYEVAINYVRDFGFGEEVYSFPTYWFGLKEWIKGSNLNPKYINSYLKNSLSAKLHVIIPDAWIRQKEETLRNICEENRTREQNGDDLITTYDGLTEVGTTFNYGMVQKLIDIKLRHISNLLAGEGENQGKTFWSRSFRTENGIEQWEFKDIPIKYQEFVKSIIEFDKRAMEVILAGKGLDPSISNVSKDGIFQSSGSNSYYNYLIYLNSLHYAEEFICQDLNRALRINFPKLRLNNITLGFFRNVPQRQEELKPDERLNSITKNQ